ncbi:hypothetical protein [Arenimonas aestuarii]
MNALAKDIDFAPAQAGTDSARYARCIEASRRIRWEIDRDVFQGREFDLSNKFLPDGLSRLDRSSLADESERRLMSQVQGRTYAYIFGLVERFINAKVLEIGQRYVLGDQVKLEALVRFSDEEIKHQEMFRRIETMIGGIMPAGYECTANPDDVARAVLGKSTWSVLALTLHIELFTQVHYKQSISPDAALSPLYKDVFLFHWREESQHAILDELELRHEHERLDAAARDAAVDDLIALVGAVDGILQAQARADADYFCAIVPRVVAADEQARIERETLAAYRWQYIVSGVQDPRFQQVLGELLTDAQMQRVGTALEPLFAAVAEGDAS